MFAKPFYEINTTQQNPPRGEHVHLCDFVCWCTPAPALTSRVRVLLKVRMSVESTVLPDETILHEDQHPRQRTDGRKAERNATKQYNRHTEPVEGRSSIKLFSRINEVEHDHNHPPPSSPEFTEASHLELRHPSRDSPELTESCSTHTYHDALQN